VDTNQSFHKAKVSHLHSHLEQRSSSSKVSISSSGGSSSTNGGCSSSGNGSSSSAPKRPERAIGG
jgi:hypothetical protein